MKKIDNKVLDALSEKAKKADRKRKNQNFHPTLEDPLQRMLNAMEPGTYLRPHKHENPDKAEVFFSFRGRFLVLEFDDNGEVKDHFILDPKNGNLAADVAPRTWHTIIPLDKNCVAYEVKTGPYKPLDDKSFAPWSPKEGSPESAEYNRKLVDRFCEGLE